MGLLNTFIKDKELDYDFKPPKKLTVNTPTQDDDEEFYFAIDDKKTCDALEYDEELFDKQDRDIDRSMVEFQTTTGSFTSLQEAIDKTPENGITVFISSEKKLTEKTWTELIN